MRKSYYYIANWKMYFSHDQALEWLRENKEQLAALAQNNTIIVCPSFDNLSQLGPILKWSSVNLGAQNCSEHQRGAFTGQVSAQSLHECGVNYCIIGHSEVRAATGENNGILAEKLLCLKEAGIIPIFCIGESKQEYEGNATQAVLEEQLEPIRKVYGDKNVAKSELFIAYEPRWAIGTGIVAQSGHISQMLAIVKSSIQDCAKIHQCKLIYGGTVTSQTIGDLKLIEGLDGFLIGNASTNFQELKKIVEW